MSPFIGTCNLSPAAFITCETKYKLCANTIIAFITPTFVLRAEFEARGEEERKKIEKEFRDRGDVARERGFTPIIFLFFLLFHTCTLFLRGGAVHRHDQHGLRVCPAGHRERGVLRRVLLLHRRPRRGGEEEEEEAGALCAEELA